LLAKQRHSDRKNTLVRVPNREQDQLRSGDAGATSGARAPTLRPARQHAPGSEPPQRGCALWNATIFYLAPAFRIASFVLALSVLRANRLGFEGRISSTSAMRIRIKHSSNFTTCRNSKIKHIRNAPFAHPRVRIEMPILSKSSIAIHLHGLHEMRIAQYPPHRKVSVLVEFFEKSVTGRFLKKSTTRQRKLRKKRGADEVCLSCGEPRHAQRKYCWTCLGKDKRRKNDKSQEYAGQGRCPWCGHEACYDAWIALPGPSDEFNRLRKTCLKKWAAGVPDQLSERLRKLWIQHHGPENLLKKYGWPGVLDQITHEQLFLLNPPTKAAIGRLQRNWRNSTNAEDQSQRAPRGGLS
jgi:hypothetical protein